MTPHIICFTDSDGTFNVQTTTLKLYPAAFTAISYALEVCGDTTADLTWKIGLDARREIFLTGESVEQASVAPERLKNPDRIQFCGIFGDALAPPFPLDRLELHSAAHGHVGTVDIVRE